MAAQDKQIESKNNIYSRHTAKVASTDTNTAIKFMSRT